MKSIGKLRIINKQPYLLLSHYDMCAIQHIVDLAPQEAQWWHRVERIEEDEVVAYRLYEMYIPEQYCSGAEVESDPMMMVNFYKTLKEEHGQEKANEILQTMQAWCHSHHNMAPNPSGQDIKQFKEQCENALEQGNNDPQIMLIFNKRNEYYCRIWDPEVGLVFENVEMIVGNYDFSWIDEKAKTNFKKKTIKHTNKKNRMSYPGLWSSSNQGLIDFSSDFMAKAPSTKGAKKKEEESWTTRTSKNVQSVLAGNTEEKLTAMLSSSALAKIEEARPELESRFEKISNYPMSKSYDEIEKVIALSKVLLSDVQIVYLTKLLSSSEDEIWEMEEQVLSPKEIVYWDELVANYIVELHDTIAQNMWEGPDFVTALQCAVLLDKADSPELAEQIIDMWLTAFYGALEDGIYSEELNLQDQHIRDIMTEVF